MYYTSTTILNQWRDEKKEKKSNVKNMGIEVSSNMKPKVGKCLIKNIYLYV